MMPPLLLAVWLAVSICGGEIRPSDGDQPNTEVTQNLASGLPCGPAAMAIALKLLDVPVRNHELAALPDAAGATTLRQLHEYAVSRGLFTLAAKISPEQIMKHGRVAVLHMQTPDPQGSGWIEHFVVFAGTTPNGRPVLIDPVAGNPRQGELDPAEAFEHFSGNALILSTTRLPLSLDGSFENWIKTPQTAWWLLGPVALAVGGHFVGRWWRRKV